MQAVLILVCLPLSYAGNHTMQRHFTAMPEIKDLPEYIESERVNGEIITHYTSITQRKVPVQMCMKDRLDPQYWNKSTMESKINQESFLSDAEFLKKHLNQTGVYVLLELDSCWWEDESGATGGYPQQYYDGEDFPIIDVLNGLSGKDGSDITRAEGKEPNLQSCIKWLKMYLHHGKGCLGRIVPPEVSVFLRRVSSSVVCHATGFNPKAINMTWRRDGEEMQEDVDVGETLPNGDGTFQKRANLTVSPEERERSQYTCEVEHASGLTRKTLPTLVTQTKEDDVIIGIVFAICAAICAAIAILVVVYRYRGQRSSTLVARPVRYGSVDASVGVPGGTSGASSDHPGG